MCLNTGTPKNINFSFETNGKLIILGVPILKHFRVTLLCSLICNVILRAVIIYKPNLGIRRRLREKIQSLLTSVDNSVSYVGRVIFIIINYGP